MLRQLVFGACLGALGTGAMPAQARTPGAQSEAVSKDAEAKLPAWDVVSVHPADPGRCTQRPTMRYSPDGMDAVCVPLLFVIEQAYAILQPSLILGAPEWVKSGSLWDIHAKVAGQDAAAYDALKPSDKFRMMRSALGDRFHLKTHTELRQIPVYDLVTTREGPKLKEATADETGKGHLWMRSPGKLDAEDVVLRSLPLMLNDEVGRTVVDKTGLGGRYDFVLDYVPASRAATDETGGPSIFTAIEEQLGLKLQPSKASMDVLVIDSIEQPKAN